jgi:hypothetical protein
VQRHNGDLECERLGVNTAVQRLERSATRLRVRSWLVEVYRRKLLGTQAAQTVTDSQRAF